MAKKNKNYEVIISNLPKTESEINMFTKNVAEFNLKKMEYIIDRCNISNENKYIVAKKIANMYNEQFS